MKNGELALDRNRFNSWFRDRPPMVAAWLSTRL
jgi:hypothetical protein